MAVKIIGMDVETTFGVDCDLIKQGTVFKGSIGGKESLFIKGHRTIISLDDGASWGDTVFTVYNYEPVDVEITVLGPSAK